MAGSGRPPRTAVPRVRRSRHLATANAVAVHRRRRRCRPVRRLGGADRQWQLVRVGDQPGTGSPSSLRRSSSGVPAGLESDATHNTASIEDCAVVRHDNHLVHRTGLPSCCSQLPYRTGLPTQSNSSC